MATAELNVRLASRLTRHAGFRVFRFFSRSIGPNRERAAPRGLRLGFLDEHEVLRYCARPELNLRRESVATAFRRGDACIGAFDGELVGYCWLAFDPLHHLDGVNVDFDRRMVWTYKSLVLPSHRGRGIVAALYEHGDDLCRERARDCSLLCVEHHNGPSLRAALRAGYAPFGLAAYLRGRSRLWTWRSPAVKRSGVAFHLPG